MNAIKRINARSLLCIGAVTALLGGCGVTRAPDGWLPHPSDLQEKAYGGWLHVEIAKGVEVTKEEGEFIAVQDTLVYLLTAQKGPLMIPTSTISFASVDFHEKETGKFAGWTVGGSLSTFTHGVGLIISFPVWIVVGTISTVSVSHLGSEDQDYPPPTWRASVSRYARFPQGLPESLDLQLLRPKIEKVSPHAR